MSARKKAVLLQPFAKEDCFEAGCDEAGRGCLAGPVFAAAVILPSNFAHPLLNDSKKMTKAQRDLLCPIIESLAISWAVAYADAAEIDQLNILNASILSMHRAITLLSVKPEHLIIDGNRFKPFSGIPHTCFIKGDSLYASIAAASVLAKTHRDAYMELQALKFPQYGWDRNMGYPTQVHRTAIGQWGASPLHRKSFKPLFFSV